MLKELTHLKRHIKYVLKLHIWYNSTCAKLAH